ncbi:MAG TPA: Nif3-like dinuclear metal center hexameric protein, partial [Bacteroidales bacterium]|nr:Nif3-like dinuclear metal center hexameric protein [Bacteroidales bacterium]
MKIKEITQFLESIAPLSLQENYDNSGLLIGDSETEFLKALICLDITSEVIDEAIIKKCNLIISHHPLIFGKISKITPHKPSGKCIINA